MPGRSRRRSSSCSKSAVLNPASPDPRASAGVSPLGAEGRLLGLARLGPGGVAAERASRLRGPRSRLGDQASFGGDAGGRPGSREACAIIGILDRDPVPVRGPPLRGLGPVPGLEAPSELASTVGRPLAPSRLRARASPRDAASRGLAPLQDRKCTSRLCGKNVRPQRSHGTEPRYCHHPDSAARQCRPDSAPAPQHRGTLLYRPDSAPAPQHRGTRSRGAPRAPRLHASPLEAAPPPCKTANGSPGPLARMCDRSDRTAPEPRY